MINGKKQDRFPTSNWQLVHVTKWIYPVLEKNTMKIIAFSVELSRSCSIRCLDKSIDSSYLFRYDTYSEYQVLNVCADCPWIQVSHGILGNSVIRRTSCRTSGISYGPFSNAFVRPRHNYPHTWCVSRRRMMLTYPPEAASESGV